LLRFVGEVAYLAHLEAQGSVEPDSGLVEALEGSSRLVPGRALDLGCGSGRNSIYLARHNWDVTGIDMVRGAVAAARQKAAAAGVVVQLIEGDVTRLQDLGIGDGYSLFVDAGCYHTVPVNRRDAYAVGVTTVAAPSALLLIVGFSRLFGSGITAEELRNRFSGWELIRAVSVPASEMRRYVRPGPIRAVITGAWFEPWRYVLKRI